jgi:MSHA biogenesis protein MshG
VFPPVVVQMVATGEQSGRITELLRSLSEYYDQQVDYSLKKLLIALEPILLVVVGFGVLVMAAAVYMPMWDLVKVFKHTGR